MQLQACRTVGWAFAGIVMASAGATAVAAAPGPKVEYLSRQAANRIVYTQQAWGKLGFDTSVVPSTRKPFKLRIKDKQYAHGLGHHANGEIVVDLNGQYRTFEVEVGVLWQGGGRGSVVFRIFVDDQKRYESPVMSDSDAVRPVRVDVTGADELHLVAHDAGDGITCDCATWADARLVRDPNASTRPERAKADMAPFARVVTSDPARTDGARSKRSQEYRADDVFLAREVLPAADGTYTVPLAKDGRGCIGLEWFERRLIRTLTLQFADPRRMPASDGVRIETWQGESAWQGAWKPLEAKIEKDQDRWVVDLARAGNMTGGIQKVRWVFPAGRGPIVLRRLTACASLSWKTAEVRVELAAPRAGQRGQVEVYNGQIVSPDGRTSLRCDWDLTGPLPLRLHYARARSWKTNRTVLRVRLPDAAFGVSVEDVLAGDGVYVPHAGVFVTRGPDPISLTEYRRKIAGKKTVLARVRAMPDQTFAQAMEKVHNPVQNNGPTMLSLACDNRKFVVERDGAIHFDAFADRADRAVGVYTKYAYRLIPRFGSGKDQAVSRHLDGGWLPVPVTTVKDGGVIYRQQTFVAPCDDGPVPHEPGWLDRRAVCVAAFTVEDPQDRSAEVSVSLKVATRAKTHASVELKSIADGVAILTGSRLLGFVDTRGSAPLKATIRGQEIVLAGRLTGGKSVRCSVYLPAWPAKQDDAARFSDTAALRQAVGAYWNAVLAPATQIDVPDALLMDVIRASQVHCLLAARNEAGGARIAAWVGADRYGPLESEANSVIRGMGLMGHCDFARRSLDFHIHRYNEAGYLTTGYTIMGTGWHLWTLAEHYDLTHDQAWLRRVAPEVARVCHWITRQCAMTRRLDGRGEKMPEYGLVPPGVAADWNRFAYRYVQEGHYCAGLREAARVLGEIGLPGARRLQRSAETFRDEILRAYRWTQARCPVLPLADGTWVPAYPSMVYCLGRLGEMIPGEDGNRSWCYDVELGAHHLAVLGVLDACGRDAAWILDHMEDVWFLHSGMGDYPAERNHADWFNLGGFAKVQPYYARNAEICALRDDVKPFVRAYFNTIPSLLNRENLQFWEHFHNRGAWHKPHETGYFLAQTRLMLVMERGDALWLAPLVTCNWLGDGMTVAVRNAPTRFGAVSYRIASSIRKGFIETTIDPPTRTPPKQIVLRLRHPEGKPMRAVWVDGKPHADFDAASAIVRIAPGDAPLRVKVAF